jgi:hypothetical protein
MIPSDREIQVLLEDRHIFIDPLPEPDHWSSTSLDLTLAPVVLKWTPREAGTGGGTTHLFPGKPGFKVQTLMEDAQFATKIAIDEQDGYPLEPGQLRPGLHSTEGSLSGEDAHRGACGREE